MTVIAAYRIPGQGCVLACDSRVTGDFGEIITDNDFKYLSGPTYTAVCAGTLGGLWFDLMIEPPKTLAAFRTAFRAESPFGHPGYVAIVYDHTSDALMRIDHSGDVCQAPEAFVTDGCGGDLARGMLIMSKAPKNLSEAGKVLRTTLTAVAKRNSMCGGKIRTLVRPCRG